MEPPKTTESTEGVVIASHKRSFSQKQKTLIFSAAIIGVSVIGIGAYAGIKQSASRAAGADELAALVEPASESSPYLTVSSAGQRSVCIVMPQSDIMTQSPLHLPAGSDPEAWPQRGADWDYRLSDGYSIQRSNSSDENGVWQTVFEGNDNVPDPLKDTNYYHPNGATADVVNPDVTCPDGQRDFGSVAYNVQGSPPYSGTPEDFDAVNRIQPDTSYFYRVVKKDAAGTTVVSAPVMAHTDGSSATLAKKSEDSGVVTFTIGADQALYQRDGGIYKIIGSTDPSMLLSGSKTPSELISSGKGIVVDVTSRPQESTTYVLDPGDIQLVQPKNTNYTYVLAQVYDDSRTFRVFGEPINVTTSDKSVTDLLSLSTPTLASPIKIPVDKYSNLVVNLDFNASKYLVGKAFISGWIDAPSACTGAYGFDTPITTSSHMFTWNSSCSDLRKAPLAGNYEVVAEANLTLSSGMTSQEVKIPYEVTAINPAITAAASLSKVEYGNKNVVINVQNPITFATNRPMGQFTLKNTVTGKTVADMYTDNTSTQKFVLSWVKPGTYKFAVTYTADKYQGYFNDLTLTVPTITVTKATPKITAQLADSTVSPSTAAKVRVSNPALANDVRAKGVLKLIDKSSGSVLETMNTDGTSPQVFSHKFKAGKYNLQVKFVADTKQGLFQNLVVDVPTLTVK